MNAVCKLGIVPVRLEPKDSAEMVNQLLYGEQCYILQNTNNWVEIESISDGYHGFVDRLQLVAVDQFPPVQYLTVAAVLLLRGIYLPMASLLEESELDADTREALLKAGKIRFCADRTGREAIANTARQLLGAPYLWGGRSLMGIDCSGLTQVVYKACGYAIPRDSSQQSLVGLNISLKSAQTGDLAVFSKPGKDKISHVGLVLKNDDLKVIHASGQVRIDRLTEEGIIRDDGICTHSLRGVRDIISD